MLTNFSCTFRIYYDDTDATGVVYHAQYLKYFERARTEWLRRLGYSQERLRTELNQAFTVVSVAVDYKSPARLDDLVEVTVDISKRGRASLVFAQSMRRDNLLLAQGTFRVASVSADLFKPQAIPAALQT